MFLLLAAGTLLAATAWLFAGRTHAINLNDFLVYWSAGRQLVVGGNPYGAPEVLVLERTLGYAKPTAFVLRNPPWTLPLVFVFGFLTFSTSQFFWQVFGLIALLLSVYWLIAVYSTTDETSRLAWIAAALFAPASVAIAIGQIGPLVLLGIAGFLRFQRTKWEFWAGAFLLLAAFKPHLMFLFWLALLLWSVGARQWRVLAGFMVAVATASFLAVTIDSHSFAQYFALWRQGEIVHEMIPTLSGLVRMMGGQDRYWMQFLPTALSAGWLAWYWARHRDDWAWEERLPILLLVSLLATSYSFPFDQIVLMPCVVQMVSRLNYAKRGMVTFAAAAYIAINAAMVALILLHRTTFWYVWTIPAWLIFYVGVSRSLQRQPVPAPSLSSDL